MTGSGTILKGEAEGLVAVRRGASAMRAAASIRFDSIDCRSSWAGKASGTPPRLRYEQSHTRACAGLLGDQLNIVNAFPTYDANRRAATLHPRPVSSIAMLPAAARRSLPTPLPALRPVNTLAPRTRRLLFATVLFGGLFGKSRFRKAESKSERLALSPLPNLGLMAATAARDVTV